ncbi:F-box protein (DUF295) [Arabidopsis thaliana]|uniref:F-box protein At2g05970 n=1 Tax=Arabidopsis thaliana TaxID=3702 RepID=FB99_ARATH|nr:F-box protein (DUF295) [Arabidopsis thaliana]Q9ZUF1.1 RecName: Full=F-box protein At2g05970 [Arabidopsis thaliana]AAC95174.1 hypothetical protein [Arabidopsis thaliana]AEC05987.1 F-box protein (DUF295) [Arabidopsis thaliana]|eukprot:NP_178654.1 F-box protein (DUF295) [Arabidopsis thaliana]
MIETNKKASWSELCPDVLRCVFELLSFSDLNRTRSVCSSWHSASRHCVPTQNQIPWLILFPRNNVNNNNNNSCVLFVPDDRDSLYKTKDLGVGFMLSNCLATYGSWILMMDRLCNLNILNPLTGEKIDLPRTKFDLPRLESSVACLWIDEKTKDYIVVWKIKNSLVYAKKGNHTWQQVFSMNEELSVEQIVYEHKTQKLYVHFNDSTLSIWRLSREDPHGVFENYIPFDFVFQDFLPDRRTDEELYVKEYIDTRLNIALTTSGELLKVASVVQKSKRWLFRIYKMNYIKRRWERIESLGDEALILDMGITIVAKDIPGLKRNSIYISGFDYGRKHLDHIFIFDLTTQESEPLPYCVSSSNDFSDARWFFPSFSQSPY